MNGAVATGAARRVLGPAGLYAASVRRVLRERGVRGVGERLGPAEKRLVFVVGSPRSGTTFVGRALGGLPGFVDLGEVTPHKASIPVLASLPEEEAAAHIRRVLDRVRRLALVTGWRGVEQTPETAFVLAAALRAYPSARVVHVVRDGRDVVCSLLERGWLSTGRDGADDAKLPYGPRPRFWVEPERAAEFEAASDAARAAWAWRAYVTAALAADGRRRLDLRYETIAADPHVAAAAIAEHLGIAVEPVGRSLEPFHDRSIGRFRRDLTPGQLADVEREAGPLLAELGYE